MAIFSILLSIRVVSGQYLEHVNDNTIALMTTTPSSTWFPDCPAICDKVFSLISNVVSTWGCVKTLPEQYQVCKFFAPVLGPEGVGACEAALFGGCFWAVKEWGAFNVHTCKAHICGETQTCLSQIDSSSAKCEDIAWSGNVWGLSAKGANLQSYIPMMPFIGCVGNGCNVDDFYCIDDADSIEFGVLTTTRVMRTVIGPVIPTSWTDCCSVTNPSDICNAPDDQVSADEICNKLGYSYAQFGKGTTNTCPEPHFDGVRWTSDWVASAGSAQYYHCYN